MLGFALSAPAWVVFLVDRDGQPIAFHGEIGDMDTTSFSSLAAGNVAATTSMAELIGEDVFPAVVHEGERESIFISVIGRSLLVVVFDGRSTLGLIKIPLKAGQFRGRSHPRRGHCKLGRDECQQLTHSSPKYPTKT